MKIYSSLDKKLKSLHVKPLAFIKDSKAVAAVEFAFIAPILLLVFIGTVEVSFMVSVDRKISRTASAVADLASQEQTLTQQNIDVFLGATERIMFPYLSRIPCVVISEVSMERQDTNGDGNVDNKDEIITRVELSSDNRQGGGTFATPASGQCNRSSVNLPDEVIARQSRTIGSEFPVPNSIKIHQSRLIVAEVAYDHFPIIGFIDSASLTQVEFDEAAISLGDRIYLRPRQ